MVKEAVRQMIGTGPMCRYAIDLLPMLKVMTKDCKDDLKLDEPVSILTFLFLRGGGGNTRVKILKCILLLLIY